MVSFFIWIPALIRYDWDMTKLQKPIMLALMMLSSSAVYAQEDNHGLETLYYDTVTEDGMFEGGKMLVPIEPMDGLIRSGVGEVTTLLDNGPNANRIDLVFVGDGYLESELGSFATHANIGMAAFLGIEPFTEYQGLFNVHRVDVISNESGVDHDPYGTYRDTAMDMAFWCNNTERLLCVNTSKAWGYANNVPSADITLAVANSSKYGGAGYTSSNVATFSGANSAAPDVAIHELGHSLGNLADEYFYTNDTYTGSEPSAKNASIYDAATMAEYGLKWANWLGENQSEWDGLVDTYEGCMYSAYGIYRPSNNSMMRALGRPFNLPSAESFIIEFYKIVDVIDDATPCCYVSGNDTVFVDTVDIAHAFTITWTLEDEIIDAFQNQLEVDLSELSLEEGNHILKVDVVDPTPWVRDEEARSAHMTGHSQWIVQVTEPNCLGDTNGDNFVDVSDLLEVIDAWGPCVGCDADINEDSTVDVSDLLLVIDAWGACS
jgi:hypothetical protein